jgi:dGTPase
VRERAASRPAVWRAQTIIALINRLSTDLVEQTAARLERAAPRDVDAVRASPERFVGLGASLAATFASLKRHLRETLYEHPEVREKNAQAEPVIGDLFRAYVSGARALPDHARARFDEDGEMRAIADYVAGMTDRFAQAEHAALREGR